MHRNDLIPIGTLSRRTGLAISAIRYYEDRGLVTSVRTGGNQRRFLRSDIRRLGFVQIAQKLGLGLAEIERELTALPQGRTPNIMDWQKISRSLRKEIDSRIQLLTRTRNKLDECIGCGCLSLDRCALYNKEDRASAAGPGPRFVLD
ncbi:MAG: redox-sensitive transcriptional activator SoxR [Novosphingobium sp.]|uniref:redox-sensitive transcriptional activator SoxR n=1 Tax=Novosphingobium sp. TaxID=1874826 RepID=UPI0027352A40|nr:redox-sensitive transcriptional activator SoxR [Novosphingobium sp.]MDP3549426.1 redox-sensitive transcriptional activator SoxR [Novosphingobium sp.]